MTTHTRQAPADERARRTESQMQQLARRVERHHTAPLPGAAAPEQYPFPAWAIATLWLGIAGGGVLGLFAGTLLRENTLVLPGIEGLYSMTPFTFQVFWLVVGVAFGIVGAAVATLLVRPPAYTARRDRPPEHADVDTAAAANVLEVGLDDREV